MSQAEMKVEEAKAISSMMYVHFVPVAGVVSVAAVSSCMAQPQIQAASLIFAQRKFSISFGAQWVIVRLCCQGRTLVMLRDWNYLRMFRFN